MDFLEIANGRQSCRCFDAGRAVEPEKLEAVLEAGRLSPSACNSQPYQITVCQGENAKAVVKAVSEMGMNKFVADVPVFLVISESAYSKTAAMGARVKHNDYRSIDIGILAAYLTAEAYTMGLSTCIIGWLNDEKLRTACGLDTTVRLVIALGYASEKDVLREKKRKTKEELIKIL